MRDVNYVLFCVLCCMRKISIGVLINVLIIEMCSLLGIIICLMILVNSSRVGVVSSVMGSD